MIAPLRIAGLVLLAAVFALFWPALEVLWTLWLDTAVTTYTHGLLIAPLCAVLAWRNLHGPLPSAAQSAADPRRAVFIALLLALVIGWQLAYRAGIQAGYLLLLPPLAWCAVRVAFGAGPARAVAFPLAFFYFATPVWDYLNPLAHAATIHAVRAMLRIAGVPAWFDGDMVHLSVGNFAIEDGCSGLHFFVVALAVGALIGELRRDGWRMRLRWLCIAAVLAIVMNWVRVFTIILLGHLTYMQHYVVRESHYWFGWWLFLVVLAALFVYERRLPPRPRAAQVAAPEPAPAGAARAAAAGALLVLALLAMPAIVNPLIDAHSIGDMEMLARPPAPAADRWRLAAAPRSDWAPVQVGADLERRWRFAGADGDVEVYGAWYRRQAQRKKLGGFVNRPAGDATLLEQYAVSVDGRPFAAQRVEAGGKQALLWLQYRIADKAFASATRAQLWYSAYALGTFRSPPSSVRVLRTACDPDCAAATEVLTRFVEQSEATL
jgi:exosortase